MGAVVWRVGIAVGLAAALAGCAVPTGGPEPTTTSSPGSTTTPPVPDTPPRVERPKNLADVQPCSLLTKDQHNRFGFPKDGVRLNQDPGYDGGCKWVALGDSGSFLNFQVSLGLPTSGLDRFYREKSGRLTFVPITVGGYPGVHLTVAPGTCGFRVGVSDDRTIAVSFTATLNDKPFYPDTCVEAEEITKAVLGNIPG